jgi:(1->4)-alpha-D-glucan 1-alpha-D-glucosylmutase
MLYAASQCCGPEPRPPLAENGIEQAVQTIFGQHDWLNNRAPLYVLVEKILEPGESLRSDWPVDGTVGYDFANLVNGLFIDAKNQRAFTNLYHRFIGGAIDVETVIYESKKLILQSALASELTVLTHMLEDISSTDRRARDFTRKALTDAIREVIACFPVYRTYIDERGNVGQEDRAYINEAIARAKRRNESTSAAIFDHLREVLLLASGNGSTEGYRKRLYFTLKFQQLTGPVMAKGLEDTACYVYNRLVSVNEVGGSPREFGISVESFHSASSERTEKWPYSMLATSSHDTKRSEDVRARINVLSEMPKQWSANVLRWRRTNRSRKRLLGDGRYVPDANEEYLLYQTLVGTWPFEIAGEKQHQEFTERIQRYMNKAVHEAKVNLSWVNDNPEYLEALGKFVDAILQSATGSRPNAFLQQLEKFASMVGFFGAMNSLSQVVLRVASPGVPDLYQGTELWDFSLVDPDNRRPVDFELRQRLLDDLLARQESGMVELCRELLRHYIDGRIKLWTTMRALRCRRDHQSVFQGAYIPLSAAGHKAQHLVAFARVSNDEMAIVAVPRLAYSLLAGRMEPPIGEVWGNTEIQLPPRSAGDLWNVFTGEVWPVGNARSIACRDVFANFPVALLLAG